ncbi:unnamed protein product [Ceratitis capitata]|uniref:(Mediterranean fruit fly) hypothetical protein n=1 Tax=Ceratitis capitata TaxID=7213 RepID=A0A811U355_CERCA|nr:unnamed protein product [Ceratitis capitata]
MRHSHKVPGHKCTTTNNTTNDTIYPSPTVSKTLSTSASLFHICYAALLCRLLAVMTLTIVADATLATSADNTTNSAINSNIMNKTFPIVTNAAEIALWVVCCTWDGW